jgi:hypothetical protein
MIILEVFLTLFIIALLIFGKIEIHKKTGYLFLRLSLIIAGKQYPLITVDRSPPEA